MQKKIIALAIASAMAMPAAAMAGATVYGNVNMAYEMVNDGGEAPVGTPDPVGTSAHSKSRVSSNVSTLGFKGSEDVGNGMTLVWQMEGEVGMDTGDAAGLFTSNTFGGLAGGFGTVVYGIHDTPYKMSTRGMDVFADTIADNRSLMGLAGINLDVRVSDVLAYITPDFSGLTVAVGMVGETDNTFGPTAGAVNQKIADITDRAIGNLPGTTAPWTMTATSATTLSANYKRDNWSAVLGYIGINIKNTGIESKVDVTGTKLGGSYAMDAFAVNAVYEMTALKVTGGKAEQNNLYLSGTYKVSEAGTVKAAYTMASAVKLDSGTAKGTAANQMSVGYDHAMSKNTTVFALYTSIGNGTAANYGLTSTGSTGDTAAGYTATPGLAGDPNAIAFGIRHAF